MIFKKTKTRADPMNIFCRKLNMQNPYDIKGNANKIIDLKKVNYSLRLC